jgi:hypothetical protein
MAGAFAWIMSSVLLNSRGAEPVDRGDVAVPTLFDEHATEFGKVGAERGETAVAVMLVAPAHELARHGCPNVFGG